MITLSTVNDKAALIAEIRKAIESETTLAELGRKTGISRAHFYTLLSEEGNPTLDSLLAVCEALGFKLIAIREHRPTT